MIINHTNALDEGIDDRAANKLETTPLHVF